MSLNDLETFYIKFSLYYEQPFFTYLLQSLYTQVTSEDVRMCGSGPVSACRIFGIRGKTADLS